MPNLLSPLLSSVVFASVLLLSACSPEYNWREVRGTAAPFTVTLPAKPATHARPINLDGQEVTMTMTAAKVNDVVFAVGTAELPDPAHAQKALLAMKTAMVRNIGGTVKQESLSAAGTSPTTIDLEAGGSGGPNTSGQPRTLLARFIAKDNFIYQVIVLGNENAVSREAAETFFTSFKPN